jgi:Fe-Mn family superoxide dismutase
VIRKGAHAAAPGERVKEADPLRRDLPLLVYRALEPGKGGAMFEVPPLPYDYDALEPHIDEQTMRVHHDKHHQAYVDNANKALEGTQWADASVDEVLRGIDPDRDTALRNNAGGHANHSLFWEIMSPDGGDEPEGDLADAISEAFGGFSDLKQTIVQNGVGRFGSGWSWLVWNGSGLEAYSTANQDSPLMQGHVPILGIDVWEHAYYLKYQNRRPDYLEAWWNVVNWPEVAGRLDAARG